MFLNITLPHILTLNALLFTIGVVGLFINRKNIIIVLMCLELMLLAVNLNFIAFSTFTNDIAGQVLTFFILTIAAAEVAIGLAILTLFYRHTGTISLETAKELKG